MDADPRPLEVGDEAEVRLDRIVRELRKAHRALSAEPPVARSSERLNAIVGAVDPHWSRREPPRPVRRTSPAALRQFCDAVWMRMVSRPWNVAMSAHGDAARTDLDIPDTLWLEMLWDQHCDDVARFLARQVDDQSAVDDLVQQTFLAAWRQRGQIEIDPRAWLFGVAKNLVRSYWRGRHREYRAWQNQVASAPLVTDGGIAATELAMDVAGALRTLTAKERECLVLSVSHGLNDSAIAVVQRTSQANVRQRRRRARWKLYEALSALPATHPRTGGQR